MSYAETISEKLAEQRERNQKRIRNRADNLGHALSEIYGNDPVYSENYSPRNLTKHRIKYLALKGD